MSGERKMDFERIRGPPFSGELKFHCITKSTRNFPITGRATITPSNFLEAWFDSVFDAFFVIFRVMRVIAGHWCAQIRVSLVL